MASVSKLPNPGVVLDLDSEEKDEKSVKPPFVVLVGGKEITFADPNDLDWRDLSTVEIPADLLRCSLSSADLDHLSKQPLPTWKFNKLMEDYYTHYDLEDKIRDAQRRAQFGR